MNIHILIATLACSQSTETFDPSVRYAAVFDTTVHPVNREDHALEGALIDSMVKRGAVFIDEAQSRKLRALATAKDIVEGRIPEVLNTLDADVIIAVVGRAERNDPGPGLLHGKVPARYQASLQARLIAVDTAQLLGAIPVRDHGVGNTAGLASENAFRRAGASLAAQIFDRMKEVGAARAELLVDGLPDVVAIDRVKSAVSAIAGIKAVFVVHGSSERTKLALHLTEAAPRGDALAKAIDAVPDSGLIVLGYSGRAVRAKYDASRAPRVPTIFARFSGKAGERAAELLRRSFLETSYLAPAAESIVVLPAAKAARERRLSELGLLERDGLFVSGEVIEQSRTFDIDAEIRSTREGFELVTRGDVSCPKDQLATCTRELSKILLAKLPGALIARRTQGSTSEESMLAIRSMVMNKDLFPARAETYQEHGFGRLKIENRSKTTAIHGMIEVSAPKLSSEPIRREAPAISPGQSVEVIVPLSVAATVRAMPNVPIKIELSYDVAGRRERISQIHTIDVLEPYALDWRERDSVASFITERAAEVAELSSAAIKAIPADLAREPAARAAAFFHAESGLTYRRDPTYPGRSDEIDDVSFPSQTLARGYGDCEDLAVLVAALAESVDVRAILILSPGHVLVGVDSEIPSQSWQRLHVDPSRVVIHKGRSFIPIETTRAGATFLDAWTDAARTLEKVRRDGLELEVIDVRDAWTRFPPSKVDAERPAKSYRPSFAQLTAELKSLADERNAAIEKALGDTKDNAANPSTRARLLAALGRFEEAKAILQGAQASPAQLNNLANVELALRSASAASELYTRALESATDVETRVRVHLNAAVAAREQNDVKKVTRHLTDAVELAATPVLEQVVTDFLNGLGGDSIVPGEQGGAIDRRLLVARIQKITRSQGQVARVELSPADIVYWLEAAR